MHWIICSLVSGSRASGTTNKYGKLAAGFPLILISACRFGFEQDTKTNITPKMLPARAFLPHGLFAAPMRYYITSEKYQRTNQAILFQSIGLQYVLVMNATMQQILFLTFDEAHEFNYHFNYRAECFRHLQTMNCEAVRNVCCKRSNLTFDKPHPLFSLAVHNDRNRAIIITTKEDDTDTKNTQILHRSGGENLYSPFDNFHVRFRTRRIWKFHKHIHTYTEQKPRSREMKRETKNGKKCPA